MGCFFIYRIWDAIQDGYARTTPGKAVGFSFIPFFNCYWIFQVYWGFARDYNAFVDRHGISAQKLPEGLFLAFPIVGLAGVVPIFGILTQIASFVIGIIVVSKSCDAVNAIPARVS